MKLVCGPPAAGKSTYVREHAGATDIVIDLDLIAREHGFSRNRPASEVGALLQDRNARLAALAKEPPGRTAWVVLIAASRSLRHWWCQALAVRPDDVILIVPPRAELYRRIRNDPERRHVLQMNFALVDKWFSRERLDNPGISKSGCSLDGYPTDPLHPWNCGGA